MQIVFIDKRLQMSLGPCEHTGCIVVLLDVPGKSILFQIVTDKRRNDRRNTDGNNHVVIRRNKDLYRREEDGQVEKDVDRSFELLVFMMIAVPCLLEVCCLVVYPVLEYMVELFFRRSAQKPFR